MSAVEQRALIRAYRTASASVTTNVANFLERSWGSLTAWRDADAAAWLGRILPVMEGAVGQQAALTDAYLARLLTDQLGTAVAPKALPAPSLAQLRHGAPAVEVYTRPFVSTRAAIAEGLDLRTAARRGLERLLSLSTTDMQLARTHTTRNVLASDPRVVGYRRVPSGSKSCPLCIIASTQRYRKDRLMPIHPGCQCTVSTIVGDEDPGRVLNQNLLDATHDAIAEKYGPDAVEAGARSDPYKTPGALAVYDHGEYGPTLAVAGQHHTIL